MGFLRLSNKERRNMGKRYRMCSYRIEKEVKNRQEREIHDVFYDNMTRMYAGTWVHLMKHRVV